MEASEDITGRRMTIWNEYYTGLKALENDGLVELPRIPATAIHNAHMFYIIVKDPDVRSQLLSHLKANGIGAIFHYIPLHSSPMGISLGGDMAFLPVTDRVSERIVRLPLFADLKAEDAKKIAAAVRDFFAR